MHKRDFFDQVACSEDPLLFKQSDHCKIEILRSRLGRLDGLRVLEPGCGAGPLTEYLSDWVGPTGHVLAFDVSPRMVEKCRARIGLRGNVDVVEGTLETIRLLPAAWDLIICFRVFPHFDDKPLVLRQFHLCLAPAGRLVIANLEGSTRLNRRHGSFSQAVRHDHMPGAGGTRKMLEEAGYKIVVALDSEDEFYVEALKPVRPIMKRGTSSIQTRQESLSS